MLRYLFRQLITALELSAFLLLLLLLLIIIFNISIALFTIEDQKRFTNNGTLIFFVDSNLNIS